MDISPKLKFCCFFLLIVAAAVIRSPAGDIEKERNPRTNAGTKTKPQVKRVLLLGDSIAAGYAPTVRRLLEGEAHVIGVPKGGHMTNVALQNFNDLIGNEKWDVVHFNWGLNDLEGRRISLDQYANNLHELVARLKRTGAKLIWCSTTPVPTGKVSSPRNYKDVPAYNEVAKKIMVENGIAIDDLYELALPRLAEIQLKEDVHFTEMGYSVLGERVARHIRQALAMVTSP
jgi:acyl-CoA thioesterase-1